MTNRTGGEKRKRCAYDDGIRGPADHQSYVFAETITARTQYRLESVSTSIKPSESGVHLLADKASRDGRQSSSTISRQPSSISKRDIPISLSLSSARQEYRSISLCNQGRQRESSTFSSRSNIAGTESLPKTKRKSTIASESSSTQYPSVALDSATTTRSSSSSSLLPAHLRPSAVNDQDLLSAERYASSLRLLATWESIALKYADIDPEEDAEIDISTGRIIRGKEKVAQMPDRVIGGMSESDEEAKELRTSGNPTRLKGDSNINKQMTESFSAKIGAAVQSPLQDEDESDESDADELDTWDKDEMEIQVEALPLSHITKPRSHRPWTADDDVDLQEFMRAEERRRALFGDIDEEEEGGQEEEDVSVSARVMDKEEAMSRRTIHASSPYFPPDSHAPRLKTKDAVCLPQFFKESHKGDASRSQTASLRKLGVDSSPERPDVEDEFERLFATPSQLPTLDRCNPIFEESCASSASTYIPHIAEPAPTYLRQSSPSSASSYLVSQYTDGANSSSEESINRKHQRSRDPYTSPRLNEEDICESALLNSSPAEPDYLDDDDDEPELANAIYVEPVKQISCPKEKHTLDDDEARYASDYSIELVVEVPSRHHASFEFAADSFPDITTAHENSLDVDQSGLRRSSRRAAQGKSYALRKKRNQPPLRRYQSVDEDRTGLSDDGDMLSRYRSVKYASPCSIHENEIPEEDKTTEVGNSSLSDSDRSRSPSVVEGTPEPSTPQSPRSLDLSSIFEYLLEHDGHATTSSPESATIALGAPAEDDIVTNQATLPAITKGGLDGFTSLHQLPTVSSVASLGRSDSPPPDLAGNTEARSRYSCDLDADGLERHMSSQDENKDPQDIGLLPEQVPETASRRLSDALNIEDDEDILLLGATFEDETEVIWPEVKPDLSTANDVPSTVSDDPSTGCEMSFRSVKGEKQELSTFTAPFRCSRIIDLTGDDICDDDEHDELDEW